MRICDAPKNILNPNDLKPLTSIISNESENIFKYLIKNALKLMEYIFWEFYK